MNERFTVTRSPKIGTGKREMPDNRSEHTLIRIDRRYSTLTGVEIEVGSKGRFPVGVHKVERNR